MKAKLFLLFILAIVGAQNFVPVQAQDSLNLEVVWQKEVFPREIMDACFSADGQWIYATVANPPELIKYSAATGDSVSAFDWDTVPKSGLYDMDISSTRGNLIVTFDGDNTATLWDTHLEKAIKNISYNQSVIGVAISPDEQTLIVMRGNLETKVYNIPSSKEIQTLSFGSYTYPKINYSHNGQYFATATVYKNPHTNEKYDQIIRWDAHTLIPIDTIENLLGSGQGYNEIKFSKDDRYLSFVGQYHYGSIFDLNTKQKIFNSNNNCLSIGILPDNQHFLVYYGDFSGYYNVELLNFISKIKDYHLGAGIINSYDSSGYWKIFCAGGYAPLTILTNKLVSVKEENINNPKIDIYQVNQNIIIETKNIFDNNIYIDVINLQGKHVFQQTLLNTIPSNKFSINTLLISGIYMIKAKAGYKEYSQKIEIVR